MNNNVFVGKCIVIIMVKQRSKITSKSYVQREIRQFKFNYWNQICDDIIAKASAGDSRGYYAALKDMYGDQIITMLILS